MRPCLLFKSYFQNTHKNLLSHFFFFVFILFSVTSGCSPKKNTKTGVIDDSSLAGSGLGLLQAETFSLLTPTIAPSEITLHWTPWPSASSFLVEYGTEAGTYPFTAPNCDSHTLSSCTITGLTNGTSYYFKVSAVGTGSTTTTGTLTTTKPDLSDVTSALTPISNFNPLSAVPGAQSVTLFWSPAIGATAYQVLYGTSSGSYPTKATPTAGVTGNSFQVSGLTQDSPFYFRVQAVNSGGVVNASSEISATPIMLPSAPLTLTINQTGTNTAQLFWNAPSTASGTMQYIVYRSTSGGSAGSFFQISSSSSHTQLVDHQIIPGTSYTYLVKANNEVGEGPASNIVSLQTLSSFSISGVSIQGAGILGVAWTPSLGAGSYLVEYGTTASGTFSSNKTVTGALSTNLSLTPGISYSIRVTALSTIGTGASLPAQSTVTGVSVDAFTISGATQTGPSSAQVSWTSSTGATQYKIQYGTGGTYTLGSQTISAGSGTSSYQASFSGLSMGTTYQFIVSALNGTATGELQGLPVASVTLAGAPSHPSNLTVSSTNGPIQLSWTGSTSSGGGIQYAVMRSANGGTAQLVGLVNDPQVNYTDTPPVDGTTYSYQIIAQNSMGSSSPTSSVSIQPMGSFSIASVSLNNTIGANALEVNWGVPTGASGYSPTYILKYSIDGGNTYTPLTPTTGTTQIASSLTAGTTYTFQVTASNSTGAKALSILNSNATGIPLSPFGITSTTSNIVSGTNNTTLNWSTAQGATQYTVKYGTVSGGPYPIVSTPPLSDPTTTTTVSFAAGPSYYFRVTASNSNGSLDCISESSVSATSAPNAPTGITISATGGVVQLNWNPSTGTGGGTTQYTVYRTTASGGSYLPISVPITLNQFIDTVIPDGTAYYYVVQASNNVGPSSYSTEVGIKPLGSFTLNPPVVSGPGALTLSWSPSVGADSYILQYGSTSTAVAGTSQVVSSLSPGNNYSFQVTAISNPNGTRVYHSQTQGPVTGIPLGAFHLTSAVTGTVGSVILNWAPSLGATQYSTQYGSITGGPYPTNFSPSVSAPTTTQTVTGLSAGSNHYFRITASNANGTLDSSEDLSASTLAVPGPPTGLTATSSPGSVQLNWGAAAGLGTLQYTVYRSSGASGSGQELVYSSALDASQLSYTDSSVSNGTTYYYVVKASNEAGLGGTSNEVSVQPIAPVGISSVSISGAGGLALAWNSAAGASSYQLQYGTTVSGTFNTSVSLGSATSTTINSLTPGTSYSFQVVASNAVGSGTSVTSSAASGIPLGSFTISGATQGVSGSAQVSWTASTGASQYVVSYGTGGTYGLGSQVITNPATLTATISGLSSGVTYGFMVSASSSLGSGSLNGSPAASLTLYGVPTPPTGVSATSTNGPVQLSWTASTGGGTIQYAISRATSLAGTYTQVGLVNAPQVTFTDTPLIDGTTYYYQISATNQQGSSAASTAVSIQPIGSFALATPVINNTVGGSALQLTWVSAIGASQYTLTQASSSGGTYSAVTSTTSMPTTGTSAIVTGLPVGTTYFKVLATNSTGATATGNHSTTGYTSGIPLSAFSISSATSGGVGSTVLNWGASTGAASYTAKYGVSSGTYTTPFGTSATAPTTNLTVTGLAAGSNNYFRVTAINAYGTLDSSNEVTVTPLGVPTAPTNLIATATSGNVQLNWTASTGGGTITYTVLRSNSTGTETTLAGSSTTGTTFTDLNVVNGTTYYYTVQASNSAGSSGSSNEVSIQPVATVVINSVTLNGSESLLITWGTSGGGSVPGASSYSLQYGPNGTFGSTFNAGGSLSTTLSGLTAGTSYSFKVTASNAVGLGSSSVSNVLTGTPVSSFTMASVTQTGLGTAQVAWNASTGANQYSVSYSGGSQTVTTSPATFTGLTTGTAYNFTVAAQSTGTSGSLNASNAPLSLTPYGIPTTPSGLTASMSGTSVLLNWTASSGSGAITYTVLRSTSSSMTNPIQSSGISGNTYTDSSVTSGTTYYYTVQANNTSGSTPNSNQVSIQPIGALNISSVALNGAGGFTLSWNAAAGASSYQLQWGTTSSGTFALGSSTTGSTSASVGSLTAGTSYSFQVVASNTVGGGTSVTSPSATGVPLSSFTISGVTQSASGSAQVNWTPSTGASQYLVTYGTGGTYTLGSLLITNPSTLTATISNLSSGTNYGFMVSAISPAGSGYVNATTPGSLTLYSVPSTPTGITITSAEGPVTINWSASTGGGSITYALSRATSLAGTYTQVGLVNAPQVTFTDTPPVNGTTYYYQIVATNQQGSSPASTAVSILPIGSFTLATPTINNTVGGSALQISWGTATGATQYTLTQASSSGGTYSAVTSTTSMPTTGTSAIVTGLPSGTTYFKVLATNSTGATATGSYSTTGYTSGIPLGAFSISSATSGGTGSTVLNWGTATGAASYTAKYGSSSGTYTTTFGSTATAPTTTLTVTGLSAGSNNYFRVTATNAYGTLDSSNEVTVTPLSVPTAPTSLTANASSSSVQLNWTASTGGGTITYTVLRSNSTGTETTLAGSSSTGTTFTDLNVVNGTTYYYVVQASNAAGASSLSNEVSVQPVAAVVISSVTLSASGSLLITWGATGGGSVAGASSYSLAYGPGSPTGNTFNAGSSLSTTISSLTPGTSYSFRVTASNAIGSGASSVSSIATGTPVAAFTMASVSQTGLGTVQVAWNSSTGASQYTVSYSGGPQTTLTASPATFTGLTTGTAYQFTVAAQNSATAGSLNASNAPLSITPYAVPSAPTSLAITGTNGSVGLSWTAATGSGTITYTLVRTLLASGDPNPVQFPGLSSTSYTDSTVTPGTTYYYVVYATNLAGNSANSSQVSIKPIASFTISSIVQNNTVGANALLVSWPNVAGATTYDVYRSTTGGDPGTLIVTGTAATSTTVSSLTAGTSYSFKIVAKNAYSNNTSTTTYASGIPLSAFTLNTPTSSAVGSVGLSWTASTGVSSYQVKYGTLSGYYPNTATSTGSTSQTLSGLSGGTPYYFQVTASNGSGNFASSLDATTEVTKTPLQTFTYNWTLSPSSNYSLSSSTSLDITNSIVELTPANQQDDTALAFSQGTLGTGIAINIGSNHLYPTTATANSGAMGWNWLPKSSNLVGYWPLDSISGGTLLGTAGNGSAANGTTSGTGCSSGSSNSVVSGVVNNGIQFNYGLFCIPNPGGNFSAGTLTLAVWFKTTSVSQGFFYTNSLSQTGCSGSCSQFTYLDSSGNACVNHYGVETICSSGTNYADGNWHHFVNTIGGSSGTDKIYIDGKLAATGSFTSASVGSNSFILGGSILGGNYYYYTGSLDELAIWNTGLLPADIYTLYSRQKNQRYQGTFTSRVMDSMLSGSSWSSLSWFGSLPFGKPLVPSGAETGYGSTITNFSNNLVSYWKFDENSGTSISDATGRNHTGTATAGVTLGGSGILGNAASFSGNTSYISVPNSTDFSLTGDFTLAGWFYIPTGVSTSPFNLSLLNKTGATNKNIPAPFDWYLSSDWYQVPFTPRIYLGNGGGSYSGLDGTSAVPLNQWVHLAVTMSGSTGTHYLNGAANGSGTLNPIRSADASSALYIGARADQIASFSFQGLMDEIALWKGTALSASDIQQLYRRGANRIKIQARSCSTSDCSDDANNVNWKGPDGTFSTYFSEASSSSTTFPLQNLSSVANNRYVQYRAVLESDNNSWVPNLQSIRFNPDHYMNNQPTVSSISTGPTFVNLTGFTETLGGAGCSGGTKYQLSLDGTNWKYWTGTAWGTASSYATSNPASTIHSNISTFSSQVGTGTLYIRAYLNSNGTQACQIDQISVTGSN